MLTLRVCKTLQKQVPRIRHFSATAKRIASSYENIDPLLHSKEEQAVFERYAKESVANENVILHTWPKGNFEHGYATLYTAKIESYLKYNKIDYRVNDKSGLIPLPTHKVPWITYDGTHTADSRLIIQRLNEEFNINNDAHLTAEQCQISFAFRVAMDMLYFVDMYRRYTTDENALIYLNNVFPDDPQHAQQVSSFAKKLVLDQLWQQGTGRLDGDTVYKMYVEYIDNILNYMGSKRFFCGDQISSVDFSIYALLGSIYSLDLKFPHTKQSEGVLHRVAEVLAYIDRIETEIA